MGVNERTRLGRTRSSSFVTNNSKLLGFDDVVVVAKAPVYKLLLCFGSDKAGKEMRGHGRKYREAAGGAAER